MVRLAHELEFRKILTTLTAPERWFQDERLSVTLFTCSAQF